MDNSCNGDVVVNCNNAQWREHLQLVVSNGFLVVLGVELVWSHSIAQCLCTAYCRNKTPHVLSSPRRPESAFPGPISHHLCRECSKSIFLSVCLFLSFMPYVILLWFNIVTLVCLSPQSPLFLSLRCSCLSLILVPVHAGSWRGVVLWSSALFVFTCCLLICLFLFCDSILFSFTKVLEVLFCLPAGWLFSNSSQVFIGCPKKLSRPKLKHQLSPCCLHWNRLQFQFMKACHYLNVFGHLRRCFAGVR